MLRHRAAGVDQAQREVVEVGRARAPEPNPGGRDDQVALRRQVQVRGAGIGPGEREEVVDERAEPDGLGVDCVEGPGDLGDPGVRLLARAGIATTSAAAETPAVLEAMRHDKKARGGSLTMVLPVRIGEVKIVKDVKPEAVAQALGDLRG